MNAPSAVKALSLAGLAALAAYGCANFVEIPIETPIQAKLDVSAFSRVLVGGFVAGGNDAVDANLETVRLLRSQLRTKSNLRVIDADPMPLLELAKDETPLSGNSGAADGRAGADQAGTHGPRPEIKTEKDLEPYEWLFANADFWKRIGEEYQNPLIVTGTVLFAPHSQAGFVQREQEVYDAVGRRSVVPVRTYMERKGFILALKFIFIDGRSGATIHSETFREQRLSQPERGQAGTLHLFRADGRDRAELPQRPQHTEGTRRARASSVTKLRQLLRRTTESCLVGHDSGLRRCLGNVTRCASASLGVPLSSSAPIADCDSREAE